jgi:hypothetical protein
MIRAWKDCRSRQDDVVRSLVRQTTVPAPVGAVDWHALHERIMADADGYRAGRRPAVRRMPARWGLAVRWAAVAVPIGMAAGLAATLALGRIGGGAVDVRPSIVAAIRGELPVTTVADGLMSPDAEQWVSAVVGE